MTSPFGNQTGAGFSVSPASGLSSGAIGAFGPQIAQEQQNQLADEAANPLALRGYDFGYKPQTFASDAIKWQDNKLLSDVGGSPYELRQWDIVNGNPLGSYEDLSGVFKKPSQPKEPEVDWSKVANPYSKDFDRFAWFASDPTRRSLLYGGYGAPVYQGGSGGISGLGRAMVSRNDGGYGYFDDDNALPSDLMNYRGVQYTPTGKGGRANIAAQNADYAMNALAQLFPNVKAEDLDKAAWAALKNKPEGPSGHAGRGWHYVGNPNYTVRQIAQQLGGLSPEQEKALASNDPKMMQRASQGMKAAHAADDASSSFLGNFLSDLGPLQYLAYLNPVTATAMAVLHALHGLETGNPLEAIGGAMGAYGGFQGLPGTEVAGISEPTTAELSAAGGSGSWNPGNIASVMHPDMYYAANPISQFVGEQGGYKNLYNTGKKALSAAKGLGTLDKKSPLDEYLARKYQPQQRDTVDVAGAAPTWAGRANFVQGRI